MLSLSPGALTSLSFHPAASYPHFTPHVLFAQQFCHSLHSSSCSHVKPGSIACAGTFPLSSLPFPIPHLLLPHFFQSPSPSFQISSRCSFSTLAPHTPLTPPHPCSSSDPQCTVCFSQLYPTWTSQNSPGSRMPCATLRPECSFEAWLARTRCLLEIHGKHLKRLCSVYTISHTYNKAKLVATYAVLAQYFWLSVLLCKTHSPGGGPCPEDHWWSGRNFRGKHASTCNTGKSHSFSATLSEIAGLFPK